MDNNIFKVVLLFALPASGKSEVRKFMRNMAPSDLKEKFHIGSTLQLDDFPYVHFIIRIDQELVKMNQDKMFYSHIGVFKDEREWGMLVTLLNEDYYDIVNHNTINCDSKAEYLFERIDRASQIVGMQPRLSLIDPEIRKKLAKILEPEAIQIYKDKDSQLTDDLSDKTIIIEASRGGEDGASFPLKGGKGYQYSIPLFAPEILENATILYIWVEPEESRRKNRERANPDDPGSNMNHGVAEVVMLKDYGCDDMLYLKDTSLKADTITIQANGRFYYIPVGIFDNRVDQTSFLRDQVSDWPKESVEKVGQSIKAATDKMFEGLNKK